MSKKTSATQGEPGEYNPRVQKFKEDQGNLGHGIIIDVAGIRAYLFGGKFKSFVQHQRRLVGVKMAEEIDHEHDFRVDTEDFMTPDVQDLQSGLIYAFGKMHEGNDVYVGCWGGIGRTGLFIAAMGKAVHDYKVKYEDSKEEFDPVEWTRMVYIPHAIETREQQAFVRGFDTQPVIDYLANLVALSTKVVTVEKPVEVIRTVIEEKIIEKEVIKTVYLTPWDYFTQNILGWPRKG